MTAPGTMGNAPARSAPPTANPLRNSGFGAQLARVGSVSTFTINFPPQAAERPGEEIVDVAFADGRAETLRIHDYDRVYAVPGLYEEIVQRRLNCRAPAEVAALLAEAADRIGRPRADVRVLDVGAGNGVSGEMQAAMGLRPVVGVDILPEARLAALRDRPGLYDLYLSTDLRELEPYAVRAVRALRPNALACVGAMGSGHLPAGALAAALDLLEPDALFGYAVDPELEDPSSDALRDLLAELERGGGLVELDRRRYRHRLTANGGERWWDAVVARVPADPA